MVGGDDGGGRCGIVLLVCWWHCHQNSALLHYVLLVSLPYPLSDAFFLRRPYINNSPMNHIDNMSLLCLYF